MKHRASDNPALAGHQPWRMSFWAVAVGLAAAVLFIGYPQIDFTVTNLFYGGNRAFIFNFPGIGKDLRTVFKLLFYVAVALVLIGLVLAAFFKRKLFSLDFPRWLYLVLCLALGPGLVANVLFKDNWGRARPFHVQEYGGEQKFTPALVRSDQCEDNCSFVSGEASSIYMLFFALALLVRRRRSALIGVGVLAGTAAGFIRIAQGGHFLSDVIFAGVFMALIAEVVYWLVFDVGKDELRDDGPAHTRLFNGSQSVASAARNLISKPGKRQ